MNTKARLVFSLFIIQFYFSPVFGQVKKDTTSLAEIVIKAAPIQVSLQNSASSVAVIQRTDLDKSDGIILTSVLNKIPGINMQQGSLNTNRISIRGIGARSQYGTSRIKAYFEDIPLTNGEGDTTIEDIDLETIGGIEISKGPNNTSFGSGLGGVIHLFARETSKKKTFAKSVTTYGSYGLIKQSLGAGYSDANSNLFSNYTHLQSDGFRANSSYDRKSVNVHAKQKLGVKGSLSFLGIFTRLKAFIPSSINENDFRNHPEKAASTWAAAQGYESYDKSLLGIGYQHLFSDKWSFKSSVFSNFKKAYEPRPFNILDEKTNGLGFRSSLNYKARLFSLPFEASVGTEILAEQYRFSLFENLYVSQPGQGSIAGAEFSKMKQNRNYSNYFLEVNIELVKNLHLESGLALNTTKYTLEDVFLENGKQLEQGYTFGKVWSPRVGMSYQLSGGKNIFGSISKGFSVPLVAETLTPEGQINTDLKPEVGLNYELGFKGHWLKSKLHTEVVFYSTQISNLLVARRTADDQFVGINAGESSHRGIEFAFNYALLKTTNFEISTYFSASLNDFKFKDFVDNGIDYSGNRLTGVPNQQWNAGIDLKTASGFSFNSSFTSMGKIPMNDSNTKYSESYSLLDIKVAYSCTLLKVLKATVSSGINNVLDRKYAASILPNATAFGNAAPRYYYPGSPIQFYGGLSVTYLFL
ncbi:TonB-dependent receptor family protein [Flavobacterium frigoris]|uniref:TonB-dependent receptor n=1 Tax=Flavobacterium frigoris (strain PS1) TaxID=1086011 RepID=H7FNP1_FLAFP|nr:TonB-dependent receptor [Flavobacterium frigoris]EIA10030.1 tonB-dependent receptor [Flavobacterium frigoris PS1]